MNRAEAEAALDRLALKMDRARADYETKRTPKSKKVYRACVAEFDTARTKFITEHGPRTVVPSEGEDATVHMVPVAARGVPQQ